MPGHIAVITSVLSRASKAQAEDISDYEQSSRGGSSRAESPERKSVAQLEEEFAQKRVSLMASTNATPVDRPKRIPKTMKEEVEAFMPFAEHISRAAHVRKQKTVLAEGAGELTEAQMQAVGTQCGLSVDYVRLCWDCFKACDRKGEGYVDSDALKLLLVILEHMQFTEESEALSRQLKIEKNSEPDSGLKFPEFVEIFNKACGGLASLAFRMAALKQEANSVHKMMEEAALMSEKAHNKASSEKVVNMTVQMYGVPEVHVQQYVSRELQEADACKQLPYALGLFVLFVHGVGLHSRSDQLFTIDRSIESDLRENANFAFAGILPLENGHIGNKGIDDVNNIPDFWSWLSIGMVPLLWIEAWDVSEAWGSTLARCTSVPDLLDGFGWDKERSEAVKNAAYSSAVPSNSTAYGGPVYRSDCPALQPPELPVEFYGVEKQGRGMYLYFNRVVGGLRLRQERRQKRACASEAYRETSAAFGGPCFDGHYWLRPDLRSGIFTKDELVDGNRTTYLRTGNSQAQIRQEIMQLEDERWLDPSVQKVELAFPTLNAEIGTLTVTYIHLFMPRSGHIHKTIDPVTVNLRAYNGWFNYIVDIVWVVMTFKIFFQESKEVAASMRKLGCRKGFSDYISFWNVVDWISVFGGFVIMGFWIAFLVMLHDMEATLLTGQASLNGGWETDAELEAFFEEVTSLLKYNILLHRMFAGYVVVCVFRFFKAFNAQPRLSIVTRTLAAAAVDIAHFGISFITVLFAFALSGCILYGQDLEDFEHFDRAIVTCYRLLLGDFDFQALYDIDRYEAVAWFWLNSILLLLIMMNMLLAVIMDVYAEVKGQVVNDVTLFAQTKEVTVRWWRRRQGKEVHLSKVFEALDALETETAGKHQRALDPGALMTLVPGLEEEQALEILEGANDLLEEAEEPEQSISIPASAVRVQEMLDRQFISFRTLFHLLESIAALTDTMNDKHDPRNPFARHVTGDGEQFLDSMLEKVSPALVGAAVEQAFAKRVDPVFTELVKVRDDIAACVGELGKDFERRFGALERHADQICRELEYMKSGNHARAIPHNREPYNGVFVVREERLTRRTPNSTGGVPSPTRTQRSLHSDREASANPTWYVPGER